MLHFNIETLKLLFVNSVVVLLSSLPLNFLKDSQDLVKLLILVVTLFYTIWKWNKDIKKSKNQ